MSDILGTHWAVFTREPESQGYRCEISEGRETAEPLIGHIMPVG